MSRTLQHITVLLCIAALVLISGPVHLPFAASAARTDSPVADIVARLAGLSMDQFFEQSFDEILLRYPEWITDLGIADRFGMRNDTLDNMSDAYIEETYTLMAEILDLLHTYDPAALTPEQQVSYAVYEWWLEHEITGREFMYYDYPVHHYINGYQDELFRLFTEVHPLETVEDAEDFITRLSLTDEQLVQVTQGVQTRAEMGIIPPDFILDLTVGRMRNDLAGMIPQQNAIYRAFEERSARIEGLSDADRAALLDRVADELERSFLPAYAQLYQVLDRLQRDATSDAGLWRLPEGDAYYAYMLAESTSTTMTPDEIHELGLREVERVRAEMDAVFTDLGYDTSQPLSVLMNQAINDGGFVNGVDETIDWYYTLIEGVEGHLPTYFDVAPEAELIVVAEPWGGGGYYSPGTLDGSRPGAFHAGTGGASPKYFMPSLTYHEGVPGHHFQIALAQEMDLPLFRNVIIFNGYVEGWALYAEHLAKEMGVYEYYPYGDIGRLEYELLRAARLVADTGIHAKGWTRDEARAYMTEIFDGDRWVHEVDRYVVLPGQATGYMVGMLTILDLRQRAQDALGDDFDIVAFHNVVLTNGSVPLTVLEDLVDQWIAAQLAA